MTPRNGFANNTLRSGRDEEVVELTIESLGHSGDGIAKLEGRAVFVPLAAPGDRLRVRVVQKKSSYWRGEIVEIVQAGDARREVICPLFGTCGGCQWLHIDYDAQIAAKRTRLASELRHVYRGAVDVPHSPMEFGYRRRVRLHWKIENSRLTLGFYRRKTNDLVDIITCPLLSRALNCAIASLRRTLVLASHNEPSEISGSAVLLADPLSDNAMLSLKGDREKIEIRADAFLDRPIVGVALYDPSGDVQFAGRASMTLTEHTVAADATSFTQANAEVDNHLRCDIDKLLSQCAHRFSNRVLELYAGIGNLSTLLSTHATSLTVVEVFDRAIAFLRSNLVAADRPPITIINDDAKSAVTQLIATGSTFDTILLDPPREGAKEVVAKLSRLSPSTVIYVSCDPATLARDLRILVDAGYRVEAVRGYDMMPQTFHIESVAVLRKYEGI